jgi:proline dehydrogenase
MQGIKTTLDILGESTNDPKETMAAKERYDALIKDISDQKLSSSISIKVSSLGFVHDRSKCLQYILELASEATARKVGFEIDMEGKSSVDFTLDSAKACKSTGYPITVAVQAYLNRTPDDVDSLIEQSIRVRLVKGAYVGDTDDFVDIQGRFKKLARTLVESGQSFSLGTHDPELIVWSTVKLAEYSDRVEFGMLKGLSDGTKLEFVKNKWHVMEYVPFGSNKVAYEDRRRLYLKNLESKGRFPAP